MVKNILSQGLHFDDRYIPHYEQLRKTIIDLKTLGYKISMTQGVFDLVHPGHIRYLEKAKSYGDLLVVAVDTDEYARARKQRENERRPVVPLEERLEILANLRHVDILAPRDQKDHLEDPYFIIRIVKPDVLIMSRSTKDVGEKDYEALKEICGEVVVLEPQAAITTTSRLRELLMDGASGLADHLMAAIHTYFRDSGRELVMKGGNGKHD